MTWSVHNVLFYVKYSIWFTYDKRWEPSYKFQNAAWLIRSNVYVSLILISRLKLNIYCSSGNLTRRALLFTQQYRIDSRDTVYGCGWETLLHIFPDLLCFELRDGFVCGVVLYVGVILNWMGDRTALWEGIFN